MHCRSMIGMIIAFRFRFKRGSFIISLFRYHFVYPCRVLFSFTVFTFMTAFPCISDDDWHSLLRMYSRIPITGRLCCECNRTRVTWKCLSDEWSDPSTLLCLFKDSLGSHFLPAHSILYHSSYVDPLGTITLFILKTF